MTSNEITHLMSLKSVIENGINVRSYPGGHWYLARANVKGQCLSGQKQFKLDAFEAAEISGQFYDAGFPVSQTDTDADWSTTRFRKG